MYLIATPLIVLTARKMTCNLNFAPPQYPPWYAEMALMTVHLNIA